MTGQLLAVVLLCVLGVGFCAGMLVADFVNWNERRRADRRRKAWEHR